MIIKGLRIVNYKNYSGYNALNLSVVEGKNVILIGGMNGAGKTTLSEAVRLCLYGNKIFGTPMSEIRYTEYINDMWSKGNKDQTMCVEMDVDVDDPSNPISITIKREFIRSKKSADKFTEKLTLTKNGNEVELIDRNYWEYYIQNIIPSQISRYFFFDGEKIRDIITSSQASEYLKTAIRDVTGISKYDVLATDLIEVKKRLLHNDIKPSTKKRIAALEERHKETEAQVKSLKENLERLVLNYQDLIKQMDVLKSEYNRVIGIKKDEEDSLRNELESTNALLNIMAEKVSDFAYSGLIHFIMSDIIESTLEAAKAEDDSNLSSMMDEFVQSRLPELKTALLSFGLDDSQVENIYYWLCNSFFKVDHVSNHVQTKVDLTYSQIDYIRSQLDVGEERYAFVKHLNEREDLALNKAKLEKDLQRIMNDGESHHNDEIETLMTQMESAKESIHQTEGMITVKEQESEKILKQIYMEEKNLSLSDRDRNAVDTIDKVIDNLNKRSEMQSGMSLSDFETILNEIYFKLKNKDDMVKHIYVSKDYVLRLEGYDSTDVDVEWISEGEKGILMYSIMYGLVSLSKSKLPLIIDSPLGRMDSVHVSHLISELYPNIGNQVIILSHDREITKEILPAISPVISRTYLLSRKSPKVTEGYFE